MSKVKFGRGQPGLSPAPRSQLVPHSIKGGVHRTSATGSSFDLATCPQAGYGARNPTSFSPRLGGEPRPSFMGPRAPSYSVSPKKRPPATATALSPTKESPMSAYEMQQKARFQTMQMASQYVESTTPTPPPWGLGPC